MSDSYTSFELAYVSERVVAEDQKGLHRVGFALAHRLQQRRDMGCRQVRALAAEQFEAVGPETFGVRFRRQVLDEARKTAEPLHSEHPAARHVDVTGERGQHGKRAHRLNALGRVLDGATPFEHRRLRRREEPRRRADLLRRHPRDRLGPLGRVLAHVRSERVEAVRPAGDERRVIKLLADDDIQHREPSASSTPGRTRSHTSARLLSSFSRGSTTITFGL